MAMTRKDYDRIAFHLAMQEPAPSGNGRISPVRLEHTACCEAVADALIGSNPRFRRDYFLEACKFDYWKTHKQPR
jgi:hypothetical protein